jgi:DNA-binding NtrC family response regulator
VIKPLLLVDDEPALVELLRKYLERLGYEVDVFLSAEEALTRFEADPDRYALVLTDLTLPGIKGDQMLDRMQTQRPNLLAIISSGYPFVPRSKKIVFLQKPYVPKMLAEVIQQLIGGS